MSGNTTMPIASVVNLRDVGGYPTNDGGSVRRGLAYRSNELCSIGVDDMQKLAALHLKCVYDLRTQDERTVKPDELPPGATYQVLDVAAHSKAQVSPVKIREMVSTLLADPKAINDPGGRKLVAMIKQGYRDLVSLPSAREAYRQLFTGMASTGNLPCLFHCTGGKDRTGCAGAALLTLLGVSEDVVLKDYLLSNDFIVPKYQPVIDLFKTKGGDAEILMAIIGVRPEYLNEAFDEMHSKFGTVENYLAGGLGIASAVQQTLRVLLVEQK